MIKFAIGRIDKQIYEVGISINNVTHTIMLHFDFIVCIFISIFVF